jgi:hypothetical protein
LSRDNITDISVGKFLGSRIKLQSKDGQAEQYFQISGKKSPQVHLPILVSISKQETSSD